MAYLLEMMQRPAQVPRWYPAPDESEPHRYALRAVNMRMLVQVMRALDLISPQLAGAFLKGRSVIDPATANAIAGGIRKAVTQGLDPELVANLRDSWNEFQRQQLEATHQRGEVALAGFEPFPYDANTLSNDVLHFGAFNALAAEHGGYRVS